MKFFKQYSIHFCFLISLAAVLAVFIVMIFMLRGINQPLVLHFSANTGIDEVGPISELEGLGALFIVLIVLDYFLALHLYKKDKFLSWLMASSTLFLSSLIFIFFMVMISIN